LTEQSEESGLESLEIGGVVVALERRTDELLVAAFEHLDLDSMLGVEPLLQIPWARSSADGT
jgi:hypothetical protein